MKDTWYKNGFVNFCILVFFASFINLVWDDFGTTLVWGIKTIATTAITCATFGLIGMAIGYSFKGTFNKTAQIIAYMNLGILVLGWLVAFLLVQ